MKFLECHFFVLLLSLSQYNSSWGNGRDYVVTLSDSRLQWIYQICNNISRDLTQESKNIGHFLKVVRFDTRGLPGCDRRSYGMRTDKSSIVDSNECSDHIYLPKLYKTCLWRQAEPCGVHETVHKYNLGGSEVISIWLCPRRRSF